MAACGCQETLLSQAGRMHSLTELSATSKVTRTDPLLVPNVEEGGIRWQVNRLNLNGSLKFSELTGTIMADDVSRELHVHTCFVAIY